MKRESTLEAVAVLFGVCALLLATASISGCASFQAAGREMLPVLEAEPVEQNTSNYAEGAWLVLDGMDTYQTMRFDGKCVERDPLAAKLYGTDRPPPGRVLGISRQAVDQWGEAVPEGSAYKLQVITGGRLQVDPACYKKTEKTQTP